MAKSVYDWTVREMIDATDDDQAMQAALLLMLKRPGFDSVDQFVNLLDDEWRQAITHAIDRYRHS